MPDKTWDLAPIAERLAHYRGKVAGMREQARRRYDAGLSGVHLLAGMSAATDELLLRLWRDALEPLPESIRVLLEQQTAIVAVGGSGRSEMAPYSDVDLLFLHRPAASEAFQQCTAKFVRDCWDVGHKLGHSVRTIGDTLAMARQEPQIATALIEARRLWGDERLVATLQRGFYSKVIRGRVAKFIDTCVAARAGEFQEHGLTVQQLEPDLKRSAGGLRDLHLIRWVGFARYRTTDISMLRREGALTNEDAQAVLAAQEFLSRLRVDLHLTAGKPADVLTRDEQLRLSGQFTIEGSAGQSPVERFMQQYFRHTTALSQIARRFVARQRPRSLLSHAVRFVMTHRANEIFKVGQEEIDALPQHRAAVCGDLESLLRLYELASLYGVTPAPELLEAIKQAAPNLSAGLSAESPRLFLSIMGRGARLGEVLRSMFETGILEKVIPDFAHARCLLQFNQYHSYTVDEHSLRAVEAVAAFERDSGSLGEVYREIHHKEILHLALLLHDLGKGHVEDHSEVGRRIAECVAERLALSSHLREVLVFLVHKHLLMADLALRRNTSDPDVYVPFSREVGSPEILRMLYVMTAADITAVGPGAWTNWKAELLADLYDHAMLELSGGSNPFREAEKIRAVRQKVNDCLAASAGSPEGNLPADRVRATFDTLPRQYLVATPPEQIAAALAGILRLGPDEVLVTSEYDPNLNTIDHRIITHDHLGSGCFSKIAGVLTAKRLEILAAQINTTSEGIVLDSFRVMDSDFSGPAPPARLREIEAAIRDVLTGVRTVEQLFRTHRRFETGGNASVSDLPTRVVIDNESSDRYTILDVFAHDRTGLLYTIADTLLALNLSVCLAKIGSHLDQVVDVFYVTDGDGHKIRDGRQLEGIRNQLFQRIEEFERHGLVRILT
jgi:[protein-PII] uridylyltransferase